MAIRLSDLLALLDGYEDDGSWLASEEEDDDCWINLFTASHRCSRKSYVRLLAACGHCWSPNFQLCWCCTVAICALCDCSKHQATCILPP